MGMFTKNSNNYYNHDDVFYMQLRYEFKEVIATNDIADVMVSNWSHTCKLLFPEKKHLTFTDDMQAVQVLTKNLYHKKPCSQPVEFVQVRKLHVNKILHVCMHG